MKGSSHMSVPKIYLDICSYNRPFDVQSQLRVRMETEAKLFIQASVRKIFIHYAGHLCLIMKTVKTLMTIIAK